MEFNQNVIEIDPAFEVERIVNTLQKKVHNKMRRFGGVVGLSGGVDSATMLALCVRAFGVKEIFGSMAGGAWGWLG